MPAMDDLESQLDDQLSRLGRVPLAEPVPIEDLHRRARRVRAGHAVTSFVATATAIALIAGVVVVARRNPDAGSVQVAAPDFVLGDLDAVVLAPGFDADGARNPIPASLVAKVAAVPGVKIVNGAVDTFAPVIEYHDGRPDPRLVDGVPPRTPILFTYHEGDALPLTAGRAPEASDEIIADADLLARENAGIGDKVTLGVRGGNLPFKIVGTFDLPGVDLAGIPLAAVSAAYQPKDLQFDRLDVKFDDGASPGLVRNAIAAAVGNYVVAPPSMISLPDQRLAQLEIQHAYWALLSPDAKERSDSGVGVSTDQEKANYAKYSELAKEVELRVENVQFLSEDAAALTFRIFYSGAPSPVIDQPQSGTATRVDGHWQLGTNTLCSLAALVGIKCDGAAANVKIDPPNGYEPASTLDPEIAHAFQTLADSMTSVEERAAVVAGGNTAAIHAVVLAGVNADRQDAAKPTLTIAGWRQTAPTRIEVLYSLRSDGGPSTPWPTTAAAEKTFDGHWYAAPQYACGVNGLASGGCSAFERNGTIAPPATPTSKP
jgi:hypothetical protein